MVVDDFDVPGAVFPPSEANSPLIIDSDAVLPSPISGKLLQSVAGRHSESFKSFALSSICSFRSACAGNSCRLGKSADLTVAYSTDSIQTDFLSQKKVDLAHKSSRGWSPIWNSILKEPFQAAVCCGTASTSLSRPVSISNTKPRTRTSFSIQGCDLTFLICSRVFCSGSL